MVNTYFQILLLHDDTFSTYVCLMYNLSKGKTLKASDFVE